MFAHGKHIQDPRPSHRIGSMQDVARHVDAARHVAIKGAVRGAARLSIDAPQQRTTQVCSACA